MTRSEDNPGLKLLVRPEREEAALWRRLRFEDEAGCREPLFNLYAGFARAIARRSHMRRLRTGVERFDYEQLAFEGLLQAIDRFDPTKGVPFRAFAARRIVGNIADGVARMSEIEAQIGHRRRIEQERLRSLARKGSDAPPDDAIAALGDLAIGLALGLMLEGTRLAVEAEAADPGPSAYESLAWRELESRLVAEIDKLPPKEALVIRQHYDNGLSFARIAEFLEVSRGRVSQLHRSALERLRGRVGGLG